MKSAESKQLLNRKTIIAALIFVIFGLALLFFSVVVRPAWAIALLSQIGGLMLATGALSFYWELSARRELMAEVARVVNQNTGADRLGLIGMADDYKEDWLWEGLASAKEIDVCFTQGSAWRRQHGQSLRDALRGGAKIRVALPDPNDSRLMDTLSRGTGDCSESMARKIQEAAAFFQSLKDGHPEAEVQVSLVKHPIYCPMYRFDDDYVITPSPNRREKLAKNIALKLRNPIHSQYSEDLARLFEQ